MSINKQINKSLLLILIALVIFSSINTNNIQDEVISTEELSKRVTVFNDFYHKLNPSSKHLELRVVDGSVKLFTNKDVNENEEYLVIDREQMIDNEYIYRTKYAETIEEIEEMYGFDDMVNYALSLLIEKFNPDSKWKPYMDILPTKIDNMLDGFWEKRKYTEDILKGTTLVSKFLY